MCLDWPPVKTEHALSGSQSILSAMTLLFIYIHIYPSLYSLLIPLLLTKDSEFHQANSPNTPELISILLTLICSPLEPSHLGHTPYSLYFFKNLSYLQYCRHSHPMTESPTKESPLIISGSQCFSHGVTHLVLHVSLFPVSIMILLCLDPSQ